MKITDCTNLAPEPAMGQDISGHEKKRVVLFAISDSNKPMESLIKASAFSRRLNAELAVLRIVQFEKRFNMLFPQKNITDAFSAMKRQTLIERKTWRWCNRRLLKSVAPENVIVKEGEYVSEIIRAGQEMDTVLIVLPDSMGLPGEDVTRIADETGVPVLVSRHPRGGKTILAASDLSSDTLRVLSKSLDFRDKLNSCIIFMHNIEPGDGIPSSHSETGLESEQISEEERAGTIKQILRIFAPELGPDIKSVIMNRADTPGAILEVAKNTQADIVVVGVHHHSWLDQAFGTRIAENVVDRSDRSVMVVPVENLQGNH